MSPPVYRSAWLYPAEPPSVSPRAVIVPLRLMPLVDGGVACADGPLAACGPAPCEFPAAGPPAVDRRHEADGAVLAHGIVVIHILVDQSARVFRRQRRSGSDALCFERLVPTLNFSVQLRLVGGVRTCLIPEMRVEFFDVSSDELQAVV